MVLQSTTKHEEYVGNKYSLVILVAKRARQIKEGHTPLARGASDHPLSLALKEVEEHQLQAIAPPVEEIIPATREVIASLVTGADFGEDDGDYDEGDAVDDLAALLVGPSDDDDEEDERDADVVAAPVVADPDADEDEEDDDTADADGDDDTADEGDDDDDETDA
jgi:DNA-directed RNA polymerase omega subunit